MADSKLTDLPPAGIPAGTDETYTAVDPAGTPISKSTTWNDVMGLVFNVKSGSYPTRPNTTAPVIWIGDTDPGGSALTNDIWIDNS